MKFWQMVNWVEADQLIEIARFAEELGFEGIINSDHAVYPEVVNAPYPYSEDGKAPMNPDWPYPDCWVTIAAMAASTKRLKFSTSVFVLPLRNVFEVAKATGTLALMSDNRFVLGAGLGWMKDEFDIYGVDFHSRGKRMDEMIEVMRKLWTGDMVEHHGTFYDFPRLRITPGPARQVPIYLGGASPPALRRIARVADGFMGAGNDPDEVPALLAEIHRLRCEAGRGHLPFDAVIGLTRAPDLDTYRRLEEAGMTSGLAYPFYFELGLRSSVDDKKRLMERFAREIMWPLTRDRES